MRPTNLRCSCLSAFGSGFGISRMLGFGSYVRSEAASLCCEAANALSAKSTHKHHVSGAHKHRNELACTSSNHCCHRVQVFVLIPLRSDLFRC